jgi:CheY-like chemotaxis protein
MTDKILFVDDDPCLLAAAQRVLRKRFSLDTAPNATAGLDLMAQQGPYAVVVADMGMPGMNGADFLRACRNRFPDTVRIMLTGDAEQQDVLEAVIQAELFQVLNKPCPADALTLALENGLQQYRLMTARLRMMASPLLLEKRS